MIAENGSDNLLIYPRCVSNIRDLIIMKVCRIIVRVSYTYSEHPQLQSFTFSTREAVFRQQQYSVQYYSHTRCCPCPLRGKEFKVNRSAAAIIRPFFRQIASLARIRTEGADCLIYNVWKTAAAAGR